LDDPAWSIGAVPGESAFGRRLSINVKADLEEKVSGFLSGRVESWSGGTDGARKRIVRSLNNSEKDHPE
jgi:hypothetical protein